MKKCVYLAYNRSDVNILKCYSYKKWDMDVIFDNKNLIKILKRKTVDFIIFDIESGSSFPTEILNKIRKDFSSIPLFILSHGKHEHIKKAFAKYSVLDYFEVPNDFEHIVYKIEEIFNKKDQTKVKLLKTQRELAPNNIILADKKIKYPMIIGDSPEIQSLKNFIDKSAISNFPILLTGETGTGKNMIAKIIHENSKFKNGKFVSINVSCIPDSLAESILFGAEKGSFTGAENKEGLFLSANGGTIFLDELENLPLQIQMKLLTVVETKQIRPVGGIKTKTVNFRLICATNENIKDLIKEKKFREDLFYRLDVLHHTIAPLRERKEDIMDLVVAYIKNKNKNISPDAIKKLYKHDWPGNIRELFNCLNRAYCNSFKNETIEYVDIEF